MEGGGVGAGALRRTGWLNRNLPQVTGGAVNIREVGPDAYQTHTHAAYDPCSLWGGDLIFKCITIRPCTSKGLQDTKAHKCTASVNRPEPARGGWCLPRSELLKPVSCPVGAAVTAAGTGLGGQLLSVCWCATTVHSADLAARAKETLWQSEQFIPCLGASDSAPAWHGCRCCLHVGTLLPQNLFSPSGDLDWNMLLDTGCV